MAKLEEISPILTFEKHGEKFELYENNHTLSYIIKIIDPQFGFKEHIEYNKPAEIKSPTLNAVCEYMAEQVRQEREKPLAPEKLKKIKEIVFREYEFTTRQDCKYNKIFERCYSKFLTDAEQGILDIRNIIKGE